MGHSRAASHQQQQQHARGRQAQQRRRFLIAGQQLMGLQRLYELLPGAQDALSRAPNAPVPGPCCPVALIAGVFVDTTLWSWDSQVWGSEQNMHTIWWKPRSCARAKQP